MAYRSGDDLGNYIRSRAGGSSSSSRSYGGFDDYDDDYNDYRSGYSNNAPSRSYSSYDSGDRIRNDVRDRVGGSSRYDVRDMGYTPASTSRSYGNVGGNDYMAGLSGLGDRIRSQASSRSSGMSNVPTYDSIASSVRERAGGSDVGRAMGDMIRARAQSSAPSYDSIASGIKSRMPSAMPGVGGTSIGNLPSMDMGAGIRERVMGGMSRPSPVDIGMEQGGGWGTQDTGYEDAGYNPVGMGTGGQAPTGGLIPDPGQPPLDAAAIPVDPGGAPTGGGTPGQLGSYGNPSIDQWDSAFIAAGEATGVDPTLLKAMADIESGGRGDIPLDECRDDGSGIPSCGLMQVKPDIWGKVGSTEEQIMQAATILSDAVNSGQYATHRDALFGIYFPSDDPNGTTQGSYGARVTELQNTMGPYTPGGDMGGGAIDPLTGEMYDIQGGLEGAPAQGGGGGYLPAGTDPVSVITGGFETADEVEYGFMAPAGDAAQYYTAYGDMWPDPNYHPGADLHGLYGREYMSAVPGEVVCAGTDDTGQGLTGPGSGGGCGAFNDNMAGSESGLSGRVEVYNPESGISFLYGHSQDVYVQPGQQVGAGDVLGGMGWQGPDQGDGTYDGHVHLEARITCGGQIKIIDGIAAADMVNQGMTQDEATAYFC